MKKLLKKKPPCLHEINVNEGEKYTSGKPPLTFLFKIYICLRETTNYFAYYSSYGVTSTNVSVKLPASIPLPAASSTKPSS